MTVVKGIVVCLVLANVGYFLWARGVGRTDEPVEAGLATVLRLASEGAQAARGAPPGTDPLPAGGKDLGVVPGEGGRGSGPAENIAVRCVSIGPFREASEVSHAMAALRGRGYAPRQRTVAAEVSAGVWIYLPLPGGGDGAQVLADLKAAGIKDALQMPGPERTPVISLGLYDEASRGQLRVAQLQKLGWRPSVAERRHPGNLTWADVDLKPGETTLSTTDLPGQSGRVTRLEVHDCPVSAGSS